MPRGVYTRKPNNRECSQCKQVRAIHAFGLCKHCYSTQPLQVAKQHESTKRYRQFCLQPCLRCNRISYRAGHGLCSPCYLKDYRTQNPEWWSAAQKRSKQRHLVPNKITAEQYRATHREEYRITEERRRSRKRYLPATLTKGQWNAILVAYRFSCAYCRQKAAKLTQDHVIPVSKGGGYTSDNIVPACQSCNSQKSAKLLQNPPIIRLMF